MNRLRAALALSVLTACAPAPAPASAPAAAASAPAAVSAPAAASSPADARLEEVRRAHGGAGPWAVAGYRMGEHALAVLGLPRGSFDLEVVHHAPLSVQYTCIADGAGAATGASVGKMNLSIEKAEAKDLRTLYRRKSTGQTVTLRLTAAFIARFKDVPRARLEEAGREVMSLTPEEIFETAP